MNYKPEQLCVALPSYCNHGGNITSTIWSDGTRRDYDQKLKTWIQNIKMQSKFNVNLLKQEAENFFARKQLLPIPMSPTCILIPLKVRKPKGANDGAYGYVALDSIETIEENRCGNMRSVIILKNNFGVIPTVCDYVSITQQVSIAQLVRNQYFEFLKK